MALSSHPLSVAGAAVMAKDFAEMEDSNPSANPSIHEVSDPARRVLLRGSLGLVASGILGPGMLAGCAAQGSSAAEASRRVGFASVKMLAGDAVVVSPGYTARPIYRWGDPSGIAGAMPAFKPDASNS